MGDWRNGTIRRRRRRPSDTPPMPVPLHIVEPTLTGDAGHCQSLVRALVGAATAHDVTVWAGRSIGPDRLDRPDWAGAGRLVPHFRRRWRRLQAFGLYRKLLRQPGQILVSTAGSSDVVTAHWAATGPIPPNQLFLFVHWLGGKAGKAGLWSAMARQQPHIEILTPTASVADFFRSCGFPTTVVPYPIEGPPEPRAQPRALRRKPSSTCWWPAGHALTKAWSKSSTWCARWKGAA